MRQTIRRLAASAALLAAAGCASVSIDDAVDETNRTLPAFTQGNLQLARSAGERERRARLARDLLAEPLAMDGAVQLALANSPALQALLADGWSEMALANQSGRLANPVFSFERMRAGAELEIGRMLSFGLLDLLLLPQRQGIARSQVEHAQVQLASAVVEHVAQVRQVWVRAVAAKQMLSYAEQVGRSAQASAELARRMQQVGNFTRLQRARQHAFHADATAQLASATHAATASREELVRLLGLTDEQASRLGLPERLPDLPSEPRAPSEVTAAFLQQRLDLRLARLQLEAAGRAQGLATLGSLLDAEAGVRRETAFDDASGAKHRARGWELELRLPLFDPGDAQRDAMNARTLAAAARYDAAVRSGPSQLRESYSAYRTAYDVARHYRDEVVPLRRTISEEMVLRYNGMLTGVFDLLADHREQVATVMAAIQAQQQFWLADAALAATLVGKPLAAGSAPPPASARNAGDAPH
jgi:outer membrane protein TolC